MKNKKFYPKNPQTLGEHILKKRMDLGMYQTQLGRHFGVSKDCVNNWEKGKNHPLISYYPRIIAFLEYNPFNLAQDTLGERVFAHRCTNGLSAKKFGKLIGVGEYAVLALEANRCVPRDETLIKINMIVE